MIGARARGVREVVMTKHEEYCAWVARLEVALGSRRALARQLGLRHGTLKHRIENPKTLKSEHVLALEALINRLDRRTYNSDYQS